VEAILLGPGEGELVVDTPERSIVLKAGLEQLTLSEFRYGPGLRGPVPHVHHRHVDGFYVLEGELQVLLGHDWKRVVASPGTLVLIPPRVLHTFANDSDADARFLNLHAPDGGFLDVLHGNRSGFDNEDWPDEPGRSAADAIVSGPEDGERFDRGDRVITIKGDAGDVSILEIEFESAFRVDPHDHADHVDAFLVLDGAVEFTVGNDAVLAGAGSFVAAPPGTRHGFATPGPGRATLLNLHAPDAGFAASVRSE